MTGKPKPAPAPVCEVPGCHEPRHARSLCVEHYEDLARGRPFRER